MKKPRGYAVGILSALAFLVLPGAVSAAENVNILTKQMLPPGGMSCVQPIVSDVQSFIYADGINSFEITLSDASYVALGAQVGNTALPFYLLTRDIMPDGRVRIHGDVPINAEKGAVPVSLTLLSAAGQRTCMTTVSFNERVSSNTAEVPVYIPIPQPTPSGTGSSGNGGQGGTSSGSGSNAVGTTSATGTATGTTPVAGSSLGSFFRGMCEDGSGTFELWFVLLALYIVIVAFAALGETVYFERYPYLPSGLIVGPLLLLLAFWFFAPSCRTDVWIPIVLILLGIIGLVTAYRNSRVVSIIQLPPAQK